MGALAARQSNRRVEAFAAHQAAQAKAKRQQEDAIWAQHLARSREAI
jgi:hypothetical protein